MVDSIHTGQQILDLNEKYPWTKCITWPYTENYYNDDYSKKSIKYSPNTYKLYPTGNTGPHGRIYMALNSNLEITDEVIREHSLIIIRSFSSKADESDDDESDDDESDDDNGYYINRYICIHCGEQGTDDPDCSECGKEHCVMAKTVFVSTDDDDDNEETNVEGDVEKIITRKV